MQQKRDNMREDWYGTIRKDSIQTARRIKRGQRQAAPVGAHYGLIRTPKVMTTLAPAASAGTVT